MSVNLVNESDLNKVLLYELSANTEIQPIQGTHIPKETSILKEQKTQWAQYMAVQFLKNRLRTHWHDAEQFPFLRPITVSDKEAINLPCWANEALKNREKIYFFQYDKMTDGQKDEIRHVREFLTAMATHYIDRIVSLSEKTKRPPKLYLDYLKGQSDYVTYAKALEATLKWQENQVLQEQEKTKIKPIAKLSDGYEVVELMNQAALRTEGRKMANCLSDEHQPYLEDIVKKDKKYVIYSIRNQQGTPRIDITVQRPENRVVACAAKANEFVHLKDLPLLVEFLNHLKLPMQASNLIKAHIVHKKGKYYNLFHLPKEESFTVDQLNLSKMNLKQLPHLENVTVNSFSCAQNQLENLLGAPKKIKEQFDFSENPLASFKGFPEEVKSVISPTVIPYKYKKRIQGNITIKPCKIPQNIFQIITIPERK